MTVPPTFPDKPVLDALPLMRASEELRTASDRASVIVGCALLDEALQRAICLRLLPEQGTIKAMFKAGGGALSTFDAKVQAAFLLGIFRKETRDDLKALGSLRNKFAHRHYIDSFDHQSLGAKIHGLNLANRVHAAGDIYGRANPGPINADATNRNRVIFVIQRILYYLALDGFQAPRGPEVPDF
jgi:hypothetical protein